MVAFDGVLAPDTTPTGTPLALPWTAQAAALHMLRHPDRRTTWAAVGLLRYADPIGPDTDTVRRVLEQRIAALQAVLPLAGARLRGDQWVAGEPNPPVLVPDPTIPPQAVSRFDLGTEAPLRVYAGQDGMWAAVVGHHAAFDGSNCMTLFRGIAGQEPHAVPRGRSFRRRAAPPWGAVRRLLRPAHPVAPSTPRPDHELFLSTTLPLAGRGITTRLPRACLAAAVDHNARAGRPCTRLGISLGLVADTGQGDIATYRRVDGRAGQPMDRAIEEALRTPEEPWEIVHSPRALRLLSPLVGRLSDTVLLSNFGRVDIPGLRALEVYPVARGRSAVTFGAVRLARGQSTLSLRALNLSPEDGRRLLEGAVAHLLDG